MRVISSINRMQTLSGQWLRAGCPVALVPTMGALHEGHLSLMKRARREVGPRGVVVVSVYVNPTQFGPQEDFHRYPRDRRGDLKKCRQLGADVVFTPSDATMYRGRAAGRFSTYVVEERLSQSMEGCSRPVHFRGVTTVVSKLFHIVQPRIAVFGAKDWQQAAVLKRMVWDLNLPVRLVVAPTVRESDGLALSSRNAYLTSQQRSHATVLIESIRHARKRVRSGVVPVSRLTGEVKALVRTRSTAQLDYVEFFEGTTLEPVRTARRGTHMALAVFFGKIRLLDNGRL
jgi:pantoate--beta-alanine ligase